MVTTSPLHHIENSAAGVAGDGLAMRDGSLIGKLQVEGSSAESVLSAAFGAAPSENAGVVVVDGVNIGRIRPDRYLLICEAGNESAIAEQVHAAIGDNFITISPQTNGQAMIDLSGADSIGLLSKLCGLDFDASAFPVNSVKISSLAKVRTNIWHLEEGYQLFFARSFADYMWQTIQHAAAEFGL